MKLNVWKAVGIGLTILTGAVGVVAGVVDKKLMSAEVAKQVAEAATKE